MISLKNGIICNAAMAEKTLENSEMRYSAAYPTGAERCHEAICETDIGDEAVSTAA